MKDFHDRILYLLSYLKMNQAQLADILEVAEGTVSRWTRDTKPKNFYKTFKNLQIKYDVSIDWLISGDGEMIEKTEKQENDDYQLLKESDRLYNNIAPLDPIVTGKPVY